LELEVHLGAEVDGRTWTVFGVSIWFERVQVKPCSTKASVETLHANETLEVPGLLVSMGYGT
jgi:hypothetical protein